MFRTRNAALTWVLAGALAFLALAIYVPFVRDLFSFDTLSLVDLGICVVVGIASIGWFELFKRLGQPTKPVKA